MLTISFLNVCSIRRKKSEVQNFLSSRGVHVFGMAETWLKPDISDGELAIPNYKLFRKDRIGRHGGGVGIYCHESLTVKTRSDLDSTLEVLWLEVATPTGTTLIGCGYRPPDMPVSYWDLFEQHLDNALQGRQATTVLVGDFNVDYTNVHAAGALHLHRILTKFNLNNYTSSPTRVTCRSAKLLDLFLSTSPIDGICATLLLDISDHFGVLAALPTASHVQTRKSSQQKSRQLHKVDWEKFNLDLSTELQQMPGNRAIDDMADTFTTSILSVLDKHAPLSTRRKRSRLPCPWLTDELVAAVRERNKLHRLLMKNPGHHNLREQHRLARSRARKLDRQLRNAYFTEQCRTADQHRLWSVLNTVTGRKKQSQAPQTSLVDLSRTFGDVVHDPLRPANLQIPQGPPPHEPFSEFDPVAVDDVARCLAMVDPRKATGSDLIPGFLLKKCADVLAPSLAQLVNMSLESGQVPSSFKVSHVSPLFKGGDPAIAKNYRPVSLLPIVSRILEGFVKQQLTAYLSRHQLLPVSQFAYRKSHSTEDALTLAVNRWQLAKSERKYTGVILVDMSKAFDRVQHARLLQELFSLGLYGTTLEWFRSYVSDRRQQVKAGGILSGAVPCTRGVPQGSVLGPLLFVLYTRNLHSVVPMSVCHQEFADDIVLDYSHKKPTAVTSMLSTAVTSLADWLESIGLILNSQKTQVMFVKPRGGLDVSSAVYCAQERLTETASAKYLGVVIDNDLSWKSHIDNLSKRTARSIGQLWRHGKALSFKARRAWFISMVISQLCYGSNCFYPGLTAHLLHQLMKMFKAGLRATFQQKMLVPTAPLLSLLGLPSLHHTYICKLLIFVHRCIRNAASPLFDPFFSLISEDVPPTNAPVTRGQVTSLLRIPFLPGPAGRCTIQYKASVVWNALPAAVRSTQALSTFKSSVSSLDLVSLGQ